MKSIMLFLAATLLIGASESLEGQSPAQSLPSGPLVNRPTRYAEWQIHFTYAEDSAPKNKQIQPDLVAELPPRDVTITLTKPLWHGVLVDTAGRKTELWFDGSTPYLILENAPRPNPIADDSTDTLPRFLSYDKNGKNGPTFPDIDWVNVKTYTGTETIRGTNCLVFHDPTTDAKAWIDAQTRYPVRWQAGNETRDFTFMEPPLSKLNLPNNVMVISKAIEVVRANNERQPVRGQ